MPDEKDPISNAQTLDDLLASSGKLAMKSFEEYVTLGQNAMRRLVDPKSVEGSVADDAQQAVGIAARDAMMAFNVWSRFLTLAGQGPPAPDA